MGVTEEGSSINDERKNKDGLPGKKVIGFFCFAERLNFQSFFYGQIKTIITAVTNDACPVEGMPCLR